MSDLGRLKEHAENGHLEGQDVDAIPALVDEVRRLRERVAELGGEVDVYRRFIRVVRPLLEGSHDRRIPEYKARFRRASGALMVIDEILVTPDVREGSDG